MARYRFSISRLILYTPLLAAGLAYLKNVSWHAYNPPEPKTTIIQHGNIKYDWDNVQSMTLQELFGFFTSAEIEENYEYYFYSAAQELLAPIS